MSGGGRKRSQTVRKVDDALGQIESALGTDGAAAQTNELPPAVILREPRRPQDLGGRKLPTAQILPARPQDDIITRNEIGLVFSPAAS
jgi:hypothetical protein